MRASSVISLCIAAITLCGCASPQELAAQDCSYLHGSAFDRCYQADILTRQRQAAAMLQTGLQMMANPQKPTVQTATCTQFGNTVNCTGTSQ